MSAKRARVQIHEPSGLRLIESPSKRPLSYAHRWRQIMKEYRLRYEFKIGEDGREYVSLPISDETWEAMPIKDRGYINYHYDRILDDGILRFRKLRVVDCETPAAESFNEQSTDVQRTVNERSWYAVAK